MSKTCVLITGPTSGIGKAFAELYAQKPGQLVLVSRNEEKLNDLKTALESDLCKVTIIRADLSEPGSTDRVFNTCKKEDIKVDTLINNAGSGFFMETVDLDPDKAEKSLRLNIIALTRLSMLFGKDMKERGSGQILNIASTGAYQPVPYMAPYAASKSYVLNFSEALAMELEDYGVTVSCLSPGMTDTEWFDRAGIAPKDKGFFSIKHRVKPELVAKYGIKILEKGKISSIHGLSNKLLAFLNRLFPRKMMAKISKSMLKNEVANT